MFVTGAALALGFLHGLGADHLMAIAALSVGGTSRGRASHREMFQVAVRFAAGHSLLLALGSALVLLAGWTIPSLVERAGEIAGGSLLIVMGGVGLWATATQRVYGHSHAHGDPLHVHWHLHLGRRDRHPPPAGHSHVPTLVGAVFAVSGLRALTLLGPLGHGPFSADASAFEAIGLILVFGLGILLSMSLFGIVLARALGSARAAGRVGHVAAVLTSIGSIALGVYWVFGQAFA